MKMRVEELKDKLRLMIDMEDFEGCIEVINKIKKIQKEPRRYEFEAYLAEDVYEIQLLDNSLAINKSLQKNCSNLFSEKYELEKSEKVSKWKVTMEEIVDVSYL